MKKWILGTLAISLFALIGCAGEAGSTSADESGSTNENLDTQAELQTRANDMQARMVKQSDGSYDLPGARLSFSGTMSMEDALERAKPEGTTDLSDVSTKFPPTCAGGYGAPVLVCCETGRCCGRSGYHFWCDYY